MHHSLSLALPASSLPARPPLPLIHPQEAAAPLLTPVFYLCSTVAMPLPATSILAASLEASLAEAPPHLLHRLIEARPSDRTEAARELATLLAWHLSDPPSHTPPQPPLFADDLGPIG
jgi:hypothetical protein